LVRGSSVLEISIASTDNPAIYNLKKFFISHFSRIINLKNLPLDALNELLFSDVAHT
jgi:hypothetical protein